MNKSKKKLQLEDITYYNSNQHPFSYSRSPSSTPQYCTKSPKRINANRGMLKQIAQQKIKQYKKENTGKYHKTIQELQYESLEKEKKEMREYPLMTKSSKKLYQQIRDKRNLSPQVLVRFSQYQKTREIKKIKEKVDMFLQTRNRMPKAQEIVQENMKDLETVKKVINVLNNYNK